MAQRLPTVLATLIFALLLAVSLALLVSWSGWINVSAQAREPALVKWFLESTREHSVERAAKGVDLSKRPWGKEGPSSEQLRMGLIHYQEMCATCHGAPGIEADELAQGLNPPPPDLRGEHEEEQELFWIIQNGIRMTGMPAFGPTHSDEALWAVTALVQKLPEMSPEDYRQQAEEAGLNLSSGGHDHGAEAREHEDGSEAREQDATGSDEESGETRESREDSHTHDADHHH